MRAELRNHLLAVARGDLSCKTGVTHVTGVTASSGYVPKPLQLRELRELRAKNDKSENELKNGVTQPITTTLEGAVSERVAIIEDDGSIPEVFRNAWARLNCDRPAGVSENRWWNAISGRIVPRRLGRTGSSFRLAIGRFVWILVSVLCGSWRIVADQQ